MGEEIIKLSHPYDEDGYTIFQCPFCKSDFKLENGEFYHEELTSIYCPYCGLISENSSYINEDIREQAIISAKNLGIDMLNMMFKRIENNFRSNKYLKYKANPIKKEEEKVLSDKIKDMKIIKTGCCSKQIKVYDTTISNIYCPYCGEINLWKI